MQRYTLSCAVSEDYFQEIVHYAQRGGKFVGRTIQKAILPLSDFGVDPMRSPAYSFQHV